MDRVLYKLCNAVCTSPLRHPFEQPFVHNAWLVARDDVDRRFLNDLTDMTSMVGIYLTIIPRVRMGSESIAHDAESRMGY